MRNIKFMAAAVAVAATFGLAGCAASTTHVQPAASDSAPDPEFVIYLDKNAPSLQGAEYPAWMAAKSFCTLALKSSYAIAVDDAKSQAANADLTVDEVMTIVDGAVKYRCPQVKG